MVNLQRGKKTRSDKDTKSHDKSPGYSTSEKSQHHFKIGKRGKQDLLNMIMPAGKKSEELVFSYELEIKWIVISPGRINCR